MKNVKREQEKNSKNKMTNSFNKISFKGKSVNAKHEELDDFENNMDGDSSFDTSFHLLQRSRYTLEKYFGEKPTKQEVIDFSKSLATKDLHSCLFELMFCEVFYTGMGKDKVGIARILKDKLKK